MYTEWDYKRMRNILSLVDGKRVLDVGCGDGTMLTLLTQDGYDATGIDKKIDHVPVGMNVQKMNARDLIFADKSFDTVIAMEVLEHNPESDNEQIISELRRVGQRILITVPLEEPEPLYKGHKQVFDMEKIARLFPSAKTWTIERGNSIPWVGIMECYT